MRRQATGDRGMFMAMRRALLQRPIGWALAIVLAVTGGLVASGPAAAEDPYGSVSGTVVDPDGRPLPGVAIVAVTSTGEWPVSETTTDASGRYELVVRSTSSFMLEASAWRDRDLARAWWPQARSDADAVILRLAAGEQRAGMDFRMRAGGVVRGTLTAPDGGPVEGAIAVHQRTAAGDWSLTARGTSDAAGRFRVTGLADGEYRVQGSSEGRRDLVARWWPSAGSVDAAASIRISESAMLANADIRLASSSSLAGVVRDPSGAAVAGATLAIEPVGDWQSRRTATTTSAGRYRVDGLPPGRYRFEITPPEGSPLLPATFAGADGEGFEVELARSHDGVDLTLPRGGTITGRVTGIDGAPLRDTTVSTSILRNGGFYSRVTARTGSDGAYVLQGLPGGDYTVRFEPASTGLRAEWWPDSRSSGALLAVREGETRTGIDAVLTSGGTIAGRLLDVEGATTTGKAVLLLETSRGSWAELRRVRAGGDGVFAFTGLEPGTYHLRAEPEAPGQLSAWLGGTDAAEARHAIVLGADGTRDGLRLTTASASVVAGAVLGVDGTARRGAEVALHGTDGSLQRTTSGADGRYRFEAVRAGAYRVEVRPSAADAADGYLSAALDVPSLAAGAAREDADVLLDRGIVLRGHALDRSGAPVSAIVSLRRAAADGGYTTVASFPTGADGAFRFEGSPAGRYYLHVQPTGAQGVIAAWWPAAATFEAALPIDVGVDRPKVVDVVLGAGATISGRLTDRSGAPIVGATVTAVPGGSASVLTDADGRYELVGVLPGEHRIRFQLPSPDRQVVVWWSAAGDRARETVEVVGERNAAGIDMVADRGASIAGTVTGPAGQRLSGVRVVAEQRIGQTWQERASARTDGSGAYRIVGLPAGEHRIKVEPVDEGQLATWSGGSAEASEAASVTTVLGSAVQGVDVRVRAGGSIEGVITQGPDGIARSAVVEVYRRDASTGRWALVGTTSAAWNGRYRFSTLPPGAYTVAAAQSANSTRKWWRNAADALSAQSATLAEGGALAMDVTLGDVAWPSLSTPTLQGELRVHRSITVMPGDWPVGTTFQYRWLLDGRLIGDQTRGELLIAEQYLGKTIQAQVTVSRPGYATTTVLSRVSGKLLRSSEPYITDIPYPGKTVSAQPYAHHWDVGTSFSYQWLADGVPIRGATKLTYVPTEAQQGQRLQFAMTGRRAGYETVVETSLSEPVLRWPTPIITGASSVGSTLTARVGNWPYGTTAAFQWYADGTAIRGANRSTYRIGAEYAWKRITVRVTGRPPWGLTVHRYSAATAKVARVARPTISGAARVGTTLTARATGWVSGTSFRYQWLANGKPIAGATRSTYRIPSSLANQTIAVRIVGAKSGFAEHSTVSFQTAKVRR